MFYFILGMLSELIIFPVIKSIEELFQLKLEKIKGEYAIKIAKCNKKVTKINSSDEKPHVNVMGFHVDSKEFEEELADDDF